MVRVPRPSRRMTVAAAWLAVLVVAFGAVTALIAWREHQFERSSNQVISDDQTRISTLESKLAAALINLSNEQAATTARGDQPVTPPAGQIAATPPVSTVAGPTGEKGDRGAQGIPGPPPSSDQVRAAVAAYLTANPPAAGPPPTAEEIAAAVSAYCAANSCVGARGPQGPQGDPGASIVGPEGPQGATGPGPSDDQVAGAVAAFCSARNNCVGPPGPQGPSGPAVGGWTFFVGPVEYDCADTDNNGQYTCSATAPPP